MHSEQIKKQILKKQEHNTTFRKRMLSLYKGETVRPPSNIFLLKAGLKLTGMRLNGLFKLRNFKNFFKSPPETLEISEFE